MAKISERDVPWSLRSYVLRSKNRKNVFLLLKDAKTPTEIAKELKLDVHYVSNLIAGLMNKKLIRCLTPKERKGRYYISDSCLLKIILKNGNKKNI